MHLHWRVEHLCGHGERELCHEDLKFETALPAPATDYPKILGSPQIPFWKTRVIKIILPASVVAIGITGALFLTAVSHGSHVAFRLLVLCLITTDLSQRFELADTLQDKSHTERLSVQSILPVLIIFVIYWQNTSSIDKLSRIFSPERRAHTLVLLSLCKLLSLLLLFFPEPKKWG